MPDSADLLLQVLDEAPADREVPLPREEEGSKHAVAEYQRGEGREPAWGRQARPSGWRIVVTPEASRDLERQTDLDSVDPAAIDRLSRKMGTPFRPDATRYYLDQLRRLIERPERFRPQRLSRFPRYDVILLRRCAAHPDQWIFGSGRLRIMVDRSARTIVLLKVLHVAAQRRNVLRKLYDLRFLPMSIRAIREIRRAQRDD